MSGYIGSKASVTLVDGYTQAEADAEFVQDPNGSNTDGLTDLGDTNNRFKDLYLSGGVYLGGTGSTNKLEDYEEGTWTPTFVSANGISNVTGFNAVEGKYIIIGDMVFAVAVFETTNTGAESLATGDFMVVGGLPVVGEQIGFTTLIGTGHIYDSFGSNRNATSFISLHSNLDEFYFYIQQINGAVSTADTFYVNLQYSR